MKQHHLARINWLKLNLLCHFKKWVFSRPAAQESGQIVCCPLILTSTGQCQLANSRKNNAPSFTSSCMLPPSQFIKQAKPISISTFYWCYRFKSND